MAEKWGKEKYGRKKNTERERLNGGRHLRGKTHGKRVVRTKGRHLERERHLRKEGFKRENTQGRKITHDKRVGSN